MPAHDLLAVTMTGELCDCFATKREGVHAILDAVEQAAGSKPIRVWSTADGFVEVGKARALPLQIAAGNWQALATFAGRFVPTGAGLLLDIGSTTADLVLAHYFAAKYAGLVAVDRFSAAEPATRGSRPAQGCDG